ncbi:MAG: FliG C-terminal domain-containing protein [Buchnera aphidicola (Nurudea shiraii)]
MMILNGIEKSAILLISIGINQAVKILNQLSHSEVQSLIKCMFNLGNVSCLAIDQVLFEFKKKFSSNNSTTLIDKNYVASLSKKVLGDKNTTMLFNKIKDNKDIVYGIKQLNAIDSKDIFKLLKDEHPQIITTILIYLNRNKSSEVLSYLEKSLSFNIISRIVQFSGLTRSGEHELVKVINYLLNNYQKDIYNKKGTEIVVELLKLMTYDQEKRIISEIEKYNKKLSDFIKSKTLSFEDIKNFNDSCIQHLVKHATLDELLIAMSTSSELLREKIFKNVSKKDADYLRNNLAKKNSILLNDVKKIQNNLLDIIKGSLR